jgi:hypothetical protein
LSLIIITPVKNSCNFIFYLVMTAASFSFLISFLQMTSLPTSALREPFPFPKTQPAIKNCESFYCFMRSSHERGVAAMLLWCDYWALFFFS